MIDTDKYENITPERWTVDEEDPCRVMDAQECTIARTDFVDIDEEREWQLANAQLIADAPLFVEEVKRLRERVKTEKNLKLWEEAEVKRLREAIADIANNMEAADDSYMGGFIEDLRKVIE
jgi:hypothetical protein